jgi:hypothetical protein
VSKAPAKTVTSFVHDKKNTLLTPIPLASGHRGRLQP